MTRALIVRGFDDQVHEKLGNVANQRGGAEPYPFPSREEQKQQIQPALQMRTQTYKQIMTYCDKILANVITEASDNEVCCIDFMINDGERASSKLALVIEKAYDDNRMAGLMYCTYNTNDLLNSKMNGLIKLFELHDQIFLLNEDEVYKLHATKENVHKIFLS